MGAKKKLEQIFSLCGTTRWCALPLSLNSHAVFGTLLLAWNANFTSFLETSPLLCLFVSLPISQSQKRAGLSVELMEKMITTPRFDLLKMIPLF